MIIDVHTHLYIKEFNPIPNYSTFLNSTFSRYPQLVRELEESAKRKSVTDFIEEMDKAHVDIAVTVALDLSTTYGCLLSNDDVATVVREYPDRLIGFASVDPNNIYSAVRELEKSVVKLGLKGLKLLPPLQEFYMNDPKFDPLWRKALELEIPVWTHTGHQCAAVASKAKYGSPMLIDELASRYPDLKIIMGHCAAPWFWEGWSVAVRHENVYLDISVYSDLYDYLLPIYYKAFSHNNAEHKLLFATDYPLTSLEAGVEAVQRSSIDVGFKRQILGENAAKLLNVY